MESSLRGNATGQESRSDRSYGTISQSRQDQVITESRPFQNVTKQLFTVCHSGQNFSLELASFVTFASQLLSYILIQDVILYKACSVDLGYSDRLCFQMSVYHTKVKSSSFHMLGRSAIIALFAIILAMPALLYLMEKIIKTEEWEDLEKEMQDIAATARIYKSIVEYSYPVFLAAFIGPWSDFYGRKWPLVLSASGYIIKPMAIILILQYDSVGAVATGLVSSIEKIFGGEMMYTMAAFSYLSDLTDEKTRTLRYGILAALIKFGIPVGFGIGGLLSSLNLSFEISLVVSDVLALVATLILLFGISNNRNESKIEEMRRTSRYPCLSAFNPSKHFKELVKTLLRKRTNGNRAVVILMLVTAMCIQAPMYGEFRIMYSYTRTKLGWDASEYGIFNIYQFLIGMTGTLLSMGVLCHLLKLGDSTLGFLGGVSQIASCAIYAFAKSGWMLYLATTVDMMNGVMNVAMKSIISKVCDRDEQGKIHALVGILAYLMNLGIGPLYDLIFKWSLQSFLGSVFILGIIITIPAELIFGYYWVMSYRVTQEAPPADEGDDWKGSSSNEELEASKSECEYGSTLNNRSTERLA